MSASTSQPVTTLTSMPETAAQVPASHPPTAEFVAQANASAVLYEQAEADRLAFWGEQARRLAWATPFTEVLDWSQAPFATWFGGGRLNVAYNCVDRHVEAGNGERVAIHWVGEPLDDQRSITYAQLKDEVSRAANALTEPGAGRRGPRRDLPADGPGGDRGDAGVRTPGRHALGGLRRILRLGAERPHRGCPSQTGHHHRRTVPPRQGRLVEGRRGRGRRRLRQRGARSGGAPHRDRRGLDPRTRPVVARRRGRRLPRARARGLRRRASPVLALHLRHHRQAQGHRAQHRRLPHPGQLHPLQRLRRQTRARRVLVHRRHRLGHRPHLHRLRTPVQRRHPDRLRRPPPPHPTSTATSRSSKNTVSPSITPPPP